MPRQPLPLLHCPSQPLSTFEIRDISQVRCPPICLKGLVSADLGGLGVKSVACIMLLCLQRRAFPVDTNVGRICARLGWVPLDSEDKLEELDECALE